MGEGTTTLRRFKQVEPLGRLMCATNRTHRKTTHNGLAASLVIMRLLPFTYSQWRTATSTQIEGVALPHFLAVPILWRDPDTPIRQQTQSSTTPATSPPSRPTLQDPESIAGSYHKETSFPPKFPPPRTPLPSPPPAHSARDLRASART